MSSIPPSDSPDAAGHSDEDSHEAGAVRGGEDTGPGFSDGAAGASGDEASPTGAEAVATVAVPDSGGEIERVSLDEIDVRDLLRDALRVTPAGGPRAVSRSVQRAIRERSGGRFFADAWSTSAAPRATFLVTSLLIVVLVIAAWFLLSPTGFELLGG